jgi:hypothetical protein
MIRTVLLCCLVAFASAAHEVKTETISYRDGELVLNGYLATPATLTGNVPGVLVVHDWYGCWG